MAQATLVDIYSADVLKTWQKQVSATGRTSELATINVFKEAGEALGNIISNTIP
jgi:hypothetical protein